MKKILLYTLLVLSFFTIQLNASDSKTMTKEEFIKRMMEREQRKKDLVAKTEAIREENQALDKLEKTLDKVINVLGK